MADALKDMVDRDVVEDISTRILRIEPGFDADGFVADLIATLGDLELKPRIEAIARRIAAGLSEDYRTALDVVVAVATAEPPIEGFAAWPLCTFVEIFGLRDPAASLSAMEHLTKRASCEFAVRPFLSAHWDAAYAQLVDFTASDDATVRRLPSEGTRSRLPWGIRVPRLIEDPTPGLALVERLRADPSETVRRSVANHLNDVAKDHPDLVVATTRRWAAEEPPLDRRMLSHALRTLVKAGNPGALEVLGYTTAPSLDVGAFGVTPDAVAMGDHIILEAELSSTATCRQHLVVDFVVHHVTAAGGTSPKVFKWKTLTIEPGETVRLKKRRMIQQASTRTYRAGTHRVELQVAGKVVAEAAFEVIV
jgi:3-methyladenine DNA glycosylase AlkC